MKKIPEDDNHPYTEVCESCGKAQTVRTQGNEKHCEYITYVYVECECGDHVCFSLPVN